MIVAVALFSAFRRRRGGLELAFAADLWGILLIAVLCAGSDGASKPVRAHLLLRDRPRGPPSSHCAAT